MYSNFPAKNTVRTPYMRKYVWANPCYDPCVYVPHPCEKCNCASYNAALLTLCCPAHCEWACRVCVYACVCASVLCANELVLCVCVCVCVCECVCVWMCVYASVLCTNELVVCMLTCIVLEAGWILMRWLFASVASTCVADCLHKRCWLPLPALQIACLQLIHLYEGNKKWSLNPRLWMITYETNWHRLHHKVSLHPRLLMTDDHLWHILALHTLHVKPDS